MEVLNKHGLTASGYRELMNSQSSMSPLGSQGQTDQSPTNI